MNVGEFTARLRDACRREGLPLPIIDRRSPGTVKMRIRLKPRLHISIYYNEDTGTLTSALIRMSQRIFGYDAYPSKRRWHTHPLGRVRLHGESRELSIEEIINIYASVLSKLNIM